MANSKPALQRFTPNITEDPMLDNNFLQLQEINIQLETYINALEQRLILLETRNTETEE